MACRAAMGREADRTATCLDYWVRRAADAHYEGGNQVMTLAEGDDDNGYGVGGGGTAAAHGARALSRAQPTRWPYSGCIRGSRRGTTS